MPAVAVLRSWATHRARPSSAAGYQQRGGAHAAAFSANRPRTPAVASARPTLSSATKHSDHEHVETQEAEAGRRRQRRRNHAGCEDVSQASYRRQDVAAASAQPRSGRRQRAMDPSRRRTLGRGRLHASSLGASRELTHELRAHPKRPSVSSIQVQLQTRLLQGLIGATRRTKSICRPCADVDHPLRSKSAGRRRNRSPFDAPAPRRKGRPPSAARAMRRATEVGS